MARASKPSTDSGIIAGAEGALEKGVVEVSKIANEVASTVHDYELVVAHAFGDFAKGAIIISEEAITAVEKEFAHFVVRKAKPPTE